MPVDSNHYRRLGKQVLTQRKKFDWTQEELSLESGVDRTYIARIEMGRANPTLDVMLRLAEVFHLRVKDLLDEV